MLVAGYFAQQRGADNGFATGEANTLLTEQGVKVGNPSQCVKQNLLAKRVFKHQGRYRVSQIGLDHLRQLVGAVFRAEHERATVDRPMPSRRRRRTGVARDDRAREVALFGTGDGARRLDRRVRDALAKVPREQFVPADLAARAYDNRPLPIGHGQTISQPLIVAVMTHLLRLGPMPASSRSAPAPAIRPRSWPSWR